MLNITSCWVILTNTVNYSTLSLPFFADGDPLGQFSVIAVGEEWRVTAKGSLDREVKDKHTLKIIATDGKFQTAATVEVHILDINDNSPLCEQVSCVFACEIKRKQLINMCWNHSSSFELIIYLNKS